MKVESYTQALRHGWDIAWHHKKLWILGLLAALIGSAGSFEFVAKFFATSADSQVVSFFGDVLERVAVSSAGLGMKVLFVVVNLLMLAVMVALLVSAQGGLILAVAATEKHKDGSVKNFLKRGRARLRPLFEINFIKIMLLGILLYLSKLLVVYAASAQDVVSGVVYVIASALILVVGLTISFLALYAAAYVVLHEKKTKEAFVDAWALFRDHWLVSLEMAVVIFVAGLLFLVVAFGGITLLGIPFMVATVGASLVGSNALSGVLFVILSIAILIWIFLVAAVYTTYAVGAWIVLFLHMDEHGFSSKTRAWVRRVLRR